MRTWGWKALGVAALALAAGCSPAKDKTASGGAAETPPIGEPFKMTVVPFEAADKLVDNYGPMTDYLAEKLGRKSGKFVVVSDYPAVITALKSGQADVAYLSSLPYALASSKIKLHPLVSPIEFGKATYRGMIFCRADSPIRTLADLRGKRVAFGDVLSTSGYLLPRRLLESNGITLKDIKAYNLTDSAAILKAVENGSADAGASYEVLLDMAYKKNPEKIRTMRIVGKTDEIPNGVYVARGDMPAAEVQKLKDIFLEMNQDPRGKAALKKAENESVVLAQDATFDGVREAAKTVGLDLKALDKK
jgi:phosphonate transport system substrate-binding protein